MPILVGDFINLYYVDESPVKDMADRMGCSTENIRRFRNSCGLPDRRRAWSREDDEHLRMELAKVCAGADFEGDMRSLAFSMRHGTSTIRRNASARWLARFAPNAIGRRHMASSSVRMPEVRFRKLSSDIPTPSFATEGSAGIDLTSDEDHDLEAGKTHLFRVGLCIAVPEGYVGLVCSRSGLALKHGVIVLNAPGILDSDYRGDSDIVGVILHNTGAAHQSYKVAKGDRIAQLVIVPHARFEMKEIDSMDSTSRGGWGSTGK